MPAWLILIIILLFLASAGNSPQQAGRDTQEAETQSQQAEEKRIEIINDCQNTAEDKSRCDDMKKSTEIAVERE